MKSPLLFLLRSLVNGEEPLLIDFEGGKESPGLSDMAGQATLTRPMIMAEAEPLATLVNRRHRTSACFAERLAVPRQRTHKLCHG